MGLESNTLLLDIEHLAYHGIVLNSEQRAALQTSLAIARDQYKFEKIYFWGKIVGSREDYYVAQGVGVNEIKARTTLYRYNIVDMITSIENIEIFVELLIWSSNIEATIVYVGSYSIRQLKSTYKS
jgi:hypothetical protein